MSAPAGIIASVDRDGTAMVKATALDDEDNDDQAVPRKSLFQLICPCFGSKTNYQTAVKGEQPMSWAVPPASVGDGGALLPPVSIGSPDYKKCLVLDLDETLVHSSFKPIPHPDFIVPVEIEGVMHYVYVLKRPGVDEFLEKWAEFYEMVVFTASLAKYANPLLDLLDIHKVVKYRLFREACVNFEGNLVKDLSKLGRELKHTIIVDNSPTSYLLHPQNAIGILSWFDDPEDRELDVLTSILDECHLVDDVTIPLATFQQRYSLRLESEHNEYEQSEN